MATANAWANPALKGMAKGQRAVAAWDEDVVTMAVEAARDALAELPRPTLSACILASTSAPFADRLNAGIVAGALNLRGDATCFDISGSMRAGSSAMIAGAALAKDGGPVLVASAERRGAKPASAAEMQIGDAAAAIVLGHDPIAILRASHSLTCDFVDHFRASGQKHDYHWEERWVREEGYLKLVPETIAALLHKAGVSPAGVTRLIVPSPLSGIAAAVARKAGIATEAVADPLSSDCGFGGATHGLLMLAHVLETAKPGDIILLAAFGNGCDALLFEVTPRIADFRPRRGVSGALAGGRSSEDYGRFLSAAGEINVEWGMRAEFGKKYALTTEFRTGREHLAFIGGRDIATGAVQFPKTPAGVAPGASGLAVYEDVPLADVAASVVSFTADWLAYNPSPPLYFGLVQFDNGARMLMEFVDVADDSLHVGAALDMVFRVKEIDRTRDYRHYFWKAVPRPGGADDAAQELEAGR